MSDSTGTSPQSADSSPLLSEEDFNEVIRCIDVLLALGKKLSSALAGQDCKEFLLSEAATVFVKTMLSLQGFLRFIPSSQFHAKEGDIVIDLSSASLMARQTIEDAISFFYLSQPSLSKDQKKFREFVWRYHAATEAFTCAKYSAELNPSLPKALATDGLDDARKEFEGRIGQPVFLAMLEAIKPDRHREEIKHGRTAYVLDKGKIVNLRGIRTREFNLPYKLFSNFAHPSGFSLLLMRQSTVQHPGQRFFTPTRFVAGFAAEVIEAFLETFSETRKLVDDEERDIISTFRRWLRIF